MFEYILRGVAFTEARLGGERNGHTHNKQKRRKDEIDKRHPINLGGIVFHPLGDIADAGQFIDKHHSKDRHTAEHVNG